MSKLALAAFVGLSFVSVQGHVQHVKGVAAIQLASPGQPTAPVPTVTLGSGTTRAIEKDRQLPPLDQCATGRLAFGTLTSYPHDSAGPAAFLPPRSSPPLHLRI